MSVLINFLINLVIDVTALDDMFLQVMDIYKTQREVTEEFSLGHSYLGYHHRYKDLAPIPLL